MLPRYRSGRHFSYSLVSTNPLLHGFFADINGPQLWQLVHRLATSDCTDARHWNLGLKTVPNIKVSGALLRLIKLPTKPYVWTQPYSHHPVQKYLHQLCEKQDITITLIRQSGASSTTPGDKRSWSIFETSVILHRSRGEPLQQLFIPVWSVDV